MPGVLLERYVDDLDMYEARQTLMMAQGAGLGFGGNERAWNRLFERAYPTEASEAEFVFRYEGRAVSIPQLKDHLSERWGSGFSAD